MTSGAARSTRPNAVSVRDQRVFRVRSTKGQRHQLRGGFDRSPTSVAILHIDSRGDGQPIGGLYAVGNDAASVFGGTYPAAGSTPRSCNDIWLYRGTPLGGSFLGFIAVKIRFFSSST